MTPILGNSRLCESRFDHPHRHRQRKNITMIKGGSKNHRRTGRTLLKKTALEMNSGKNIIVIGPFGIGKSYFCRSLRSLQAYSHFGLIPRKPARNGYPYASAVDYRALPLETSKRKRSEWYKLRRHKITLFSHIPHAQIPPCSSCQQGKVPHYFGRNILKLSDQKLDFIEH